MKFFNIIFKNLFAAFVANLIYGLIFQKWGKDIISSTVVLAFGLTLADWLNVKRKSKKQI